MNHTSLLYTLILFICTGIYQLHAQIMIKADRTNAQYEVGELMHFEIEATEAGELTYGLRYDNRAKDFVSGTISLNAGEQFKIPYTATEPCFILCRVELNGQEEYASAAFAPFDILPFEEEPSDLDSFWNAAKMELAMVEMDPQLDFHEESSYSTTYKINLGNIANRRVYGYITVPKGEGPYPAVLIIPSFGDAPNHVKPKRYIAELGGAIAVSISIHDIEPDQYDPDSYQPNDSADPNTIYYKFALMGAVRSIDYIFSRDDFNGVDLAVIGSSQGGGLSLLTAGIDDRVSLLINNIAALSQHSGLKYGRASGHPFYIFNSRITEDDMAHEKATVEATKYYDAVFLARRFKGPSLTLISYEDTTCPPATTFAAYNQLRGPKILQHARDLGHENLDFNVLRFEFFRNHFPGSLTPPNPDSEMRLFYDIDISEDQTIGVGAEINLSASVRLNNDEVTDNLSKSWSVLDGTGRSIFSNPNSSNTNVRFDKPGEYLVQFTAHDNRELTDRARIYTISDYVKIIVE